ncbi:fatty-acid-binding protein 1-like [Coffea eugenioides]|uniref:fatty-acid-binding protein 1-like n=1 Tax=Coffea eugenioides TaxID=49369 RepID=UPI000F6085F3|nr:fatty-acid-binding protein 1-like [Coffea eugenioides]
MPTAVDEVTAKTEMVEIEPNTGLALKTATNEEKANDEPEAKISTGEAPKPKDMQQKNEPGDPDDAKGQTVGEEKEPECHKEQEADVPVEVEPKTGVSFPVKLNDGKQLEAVGLRKKSMLGLGIKIYAFGIYADNDELKALVRDKIGKAPAKPTKEMYHMVIDSDVGTIVRLVIVFSSLTMSMVRKNFDEGLGAAIKKLTGGKKEELTKMIMGEASDDIKLIPGSEIEISRLPGYILQTKVMGEVVSNVQSELLCRAYMYLYLGDDPFDKEAKDKFGSSLLHLF